MRSTGWLAQPLGLSVTTIERLRVQGSQYLPPCRTISKSIRYSEQAVEQWIRDADSTTSSGNWRQEPSVTLNAQKEAPTGNA